MKKVKTMLAGIAVIAVIGGAFAFKAKHAYSAELFYNYTTNTECSASASALITTAAADPHFSGKLYYTTLPEAGPCVATSTFYTTTSNE